MMTRSGLLRIAVVAAVAIVVAVDVERGDGKASSGSDPIDRRSPSKLHHPAMPSAEQEPEEVAMKGDPFAPRGWQATPPPPPVPAAPVVATVAPVNPAPPPAVEAPVAPALPYVFMGQFDDGGRQVVYLSRNSQTFVVTQGETLEGMYKVLAINARQVEFEHLPTGTKQVLTISASNT